MTVRDLLVDIDLKNPNDVLEEHKWGWIVTVEKQLLDECLLTHELSEEEMQQAARMFAMEHITSDYRPLAQPPYHELYIHYVNSQISLSNLDNESYANEQTLYNNALLTFKNYWNRHHRSKAGGKKVKF